MHAVHARGGAPSVTTIARTVLALGTACSSCRKRPRIWEERTTPLGAGFRDPQFWHASPTPGVYTTGSRSAGYCFKRPKKPSGSTVCTDARYEYLSKVPVSASTAALRWPKSCIAAVTCRLQAESSLMGTCSNVLACARCHTDTPASMDLGRCFRMGQLECHSIDNSSQGTRHCHRVSDTR